MVKAAIGKDADLELVKKLKIESKGERLENRILVLSSVGSFTFSFISSDILVSL